MGDKLFEKAEKTKTMEEFKALMSENGFNINEDKAEEFYARIHSDGAVSDEELDGLSGGRRDEGVRGTTTIRCPKCSAWMEIRAVAGIGICPRCGYTYDDNGYLG